MSETHYGFWATEPVPEEIPVAIEWPSIWWGKDTPQPQIGDRFGLEVYDVGKSFDDKTMIKLRPVKL